MIKLLDRFGSKYPQPDATHYSGALGKHYLKWEKHNEFFTYTLFWESLSVVAISYYAVSLAGYLIYLFLSVSGVTKGIPTAAVTLPILPVVWWAIRRISERME